MDLSTGGGALAITVFRLLHIVAGVLWVGSAVLLSFYIEPAVEKLGLDGSKFMRTLFTKTGYVKLMPIVAITTTVAGLVLYWMVTDGFASVDYMRSGQGIVLSIGVLFGLLAFGHGFAAMGRLSGKYVAMLNEAGDNPSAEQQSDITALEAKLRRNGKISMWLGVFALLFMAGARYVNPLFG